MSPDCSCILSVYCYCLVPAFLNGCWKPIIVFCIGLWCPWRMDETVGTSWKPCRIVKGTITIDIIDTNLYNTLFCTLLLRWTSLLNNNMRKNTSIFIFVFFFSHFMFSVNPPLNHNNYICFHQPLMRPNGHHSKVPQTKLIILNTPTRTHTHTEREK